MSTIEKAAARLASRQKSKAGRGSLASTPVGSDNGNEATVGAGGAAGVNAGIEDQTHAAPPRRVGSEAVYDRPVFEHRYCEIDLAEIQSRGFITPGSGRSQLAREMRRIKRPLLLNIQRGRAEASDAPPTNLVMITSALPGEGKTFVSINLAMSIAAEMDRRVLLVDADIAKGDVARQLGLEPRRGLSDLLQESNYLSEDAVLDTNIERLTLLLAGEPSDHVDELFASDMMTEIIRGLAEADPDRVVLFDGSPLLATTEASVLARKMGQTVVVVEAGKTPQDAVIQALSQLEDCANVSLVLNKTTGKDAGGYSYGYGYGYGDSDAARAQKGEGAE